MNIHSSYRKLNDYKGASCGQPSALSPQPSALSPQPSALSPQHSASFNRKWFCLLALLIGLCAFSQSANAACYRLDRDIFFGRTPLPLFSTPFAACHQSVEDWNEIRKNETNHPSWTSSFAFKELRSEGNELDFTCIASETMLRTDDGTVFLVHDTLEMVRRYDQFSVTCPNTPLTLTLTPAPNQKDPRPLKAEGKDGKSTYELIARVMEGSTTKAGVVVGFGVGVEAQTGGHAHGDLGSIPRPKGKLSKTSGETDSNGEIKLTFIADEPAGLHAVVADCTPAGCANKATHVVKVKVPDLIHIPPDYGSSPPRYVLIGNYKTPENPAQQINHNDTHFLTDQSWENLKGLIKTFARLDWGQVGINDASLEWGGMFDIEGKWLDPVLRPNGKFTTGGHAEHRDGQQVDISFVRPASVSEALRKKVYDEACSAKEAELPRILWHKNDGYAPHFHIYLTGKSVTGAKKQCGVS